MENVFLKLMILELLIAKLLKTKKSGKQAMVDSSLQSSVNKTYAYYMQNLNKQIEENKSLRAENDARKAGKYKVLKVRWSAIWQEPEMTEAWKRVEKRKKQLPYTTASWHLQQNMR